MVESSSHASPLAESAINQVLNTPSESVEQTFDRAYALGLLLISAGFTDEGRRAVHFVSQLAKTELVGYPPGETIARKLRERALRFLTAVSRTEAADQLDANIESTSSDLEQARRPF